MYKEMFCKQSNSQNPLTRQLVHVTYRTTLTSNMVSGTCANTPSPDRFRPMLASLPTLLCEQSSFGTVHAIQYCAIGLVGVKKMTAKNTVPILGQSPKYRKTGLIENIIDREEARKTWKIQAAYPEGLSKDEVIG